MSTNDLRKIADFVRKETLIIHKQAPETRVASALSCVEILTVLYYGGIINFDPRNTKAENRDRLIISKAHGVVSIYPILADLGFFSKSELSRVCKEGSLLGGIPDMMVPGFETINGSLGHGIGVACGSAIALKSKGRMETVFVLVGDGELYEGSMWEAIMLAGDKKIDNLVVIIDNNKACMLDFCRNILDLEPLEEKFSAFRWQTVRTDGHDVVELQNILNQLKNDRSGKPKVLIADTIKGKGVPELEKDSLSHIKVLSAATVDRVLGELP